MIEQGYGRDDPRYELAQQYLALQRTRAPDRRHLAPHPGHDATRRPVKLFEEQCCMAPVNAAREARRGTLDPTYLVYTLGKWRILDLRER